MQNPKMLTFLIHHHGSLLKRAFNFTLTIQLTSSPASSRAEVVNHSLTLKLPDELTIELWRCLVHAWQIEILRHDLEPLH